MQPTVPKSTECHIFAEKLLYKSSFIGIYHAVNMDWSGFSKPSCSVSDQSCCSLYSTIKLFMLAYILLIEKPHNSQGRSLFPILAIALLINKAQIQ